MSTRYLVRPYEIGDELEIVELLRMVFPEWARRSSPLDYWIWKYRSTPLGSLIAVALFDGKIIGVTHDISLNLKLGDTVYLCQYGDDTATHPDHQGKGVYRMINEVNDKEQEKIGVKITYSVPIHPAFTRTPRPYQHFLPQQIVHYIKVNDPKAYLKNKKISNIRLVELGLSSLSIFNKLNSTLRKKTDGKLKVIDVEKFGNDVDSIWSSMSNRLNFSLVRTSEYLNWRYTDKRAGSFIIREVFDDEDLIGYAVAEIQSRDGENEGYILDIFTNYGNLEAVTELLKSLDSTFNTLKVHSIHYKAVEGHPFLNVLGQHGFIPVPGQQKMILKINLKYIPNELFDVVENSPIEKIHFGLGDYL